MALTGRPWMPSVVLCLLGLVILGSGMRTNGGEGQQPSEDTLVMPSLDPNSASWPQLVGMNGKAAQNLLQLALPGVKVQIVPNGAAVTMDYCTSRVRIFVTDTTDSGTVVRAPSRG